MAYACRYSGPTTVNRTSWGPVSTHVDNKVFERPLSGDYDRIINAFDRTNAFEYVRKLRSTFENNEKVEGNFGGMLERKSEERFMGQGEMVVNRKMSSSYERADNALATQTPCSDDDVAEYYQEKIMYSQARQLFPLQEDLADWINKTIGIDYLTGENFLDLLDNGVDLCQLAAVMHDKAKEAQVQGMYTGPVPIIRGRCWQRAARRSFFSRDNAENFITFCRELGVHDNLLFESDDLVLHNNPRQVILCLLELARLGTKFDVEPPGLVQLEKEIALEERDSGLDSAMSGVGWQFQVEDGERDKSSANPPPSPETTDEGNVQDNVDNESTPSVASNDSDVPLKPTNELDKRVQLVTRLMERGCRCGEGRCSKLLKVKKVGEGRYNIAGRNVFIRLLKGRHMMVRVGGGWDTLEHFLSRHEPCQVRLVTPARRADPPANPTLSIRTPRTPSDTSIDLAKLSPIAKSPASSISGKISPIRSTSGKTSPVDNDSNSKSSLSGKSSPLDRKISVTSKSSTDGKKTPTSGKIGSLERRSVSSGKITSVDSRKSSISGKTSPLDGKRFNANRDRKVSPATSIASSGKTSPINEMTKRRTSTPNTQRTLKSSMTLPLKSINDELDSAKKTLTRQRKQSAPPSFSTPTTPRSKTPTTDRKSFCGTDRLNAAAAAKKNRSASLASTPTSEPKPFLSTRKGRSLSLISTPTNYYKPINISLKGASQADIEESVRRSLQNSIIESATQPFLHIKAKYRSPPPREVPPR